MTEVQLASWLAGLGAGLEPIAACVRAQLPTEFFIEESSGALLVRHQPGIGSEAYALTLFPGLSATQIDKYGQLHGVGIPAALREMLQRVNGFHLLDLSVFGIPPSMLGDPPLLSRARRNPLDIATAIRSWRFEYDASPSDGSYFAVRDISSNEQLGYFLMPDGAVKGYLKEAGTESGAWPSFSEWLVDEVAEAQRAGWHSTPSTGGAVLAA